MELIKMSFEAMVTRAILEDHFTPVLHKIAGEQDAYAAKTTRLNAAGNIMLGAGSAMLAFGAKSIQAAGKVDEFRKIVEKVRGANEAAFATKFVNDFDKHSSFAYFDLIDAAKMLEIQNVDLGKSFGDVADLAATSGRSLIDVARVYDAVKGGGRVGLGLSSRGGFAQFGINPREIFEAEGIKWTGKNLQNSMTADQLLDGVHKVLEKHGKSGYDAVSATTTLRGAKSMIDGSIERLETNIGAANLPTTIKYLNEAAGAINHLGDAIKNVPGFGDKFMVAGGLLVAVGTIYKIVVGVREWKSAFDLAKIASDKSAASWKTLAGAKKLAEGVAKTENRAEIDKLGTLSKEGDLLEKTSGKWGGLKDMLTKVGIKAAGAQDGLLKLGTAALGAGAEGASLSTIMAAGAASMGLYAIAAVGAAADIYAVVAALHALGTASTDTQNAQKANKEAIAQGYDLKQSHMTGDGAKSIWRQWGDSLWDVLTNAPDSEDKAGSTALIDKDWGKRKHSIAPGGLRAAQIAAQQASQASAAAASQAAADAAKEAGGEAANKYELPADLDYKLKHDERVIEALKTQKGSQQALNDAKKVEIAHLEKAHDLLLANAKLATDDKARYKLLNEAEEKSQQAELLKIADKRDLMDKTISTILGGGGISDEEMLKRTGIGRRFFRSLGGPGAKPPVDATKAMLQQATRRPMVNNFIVDGKVMASVKQEIVDDLIPALAALLNGSTPGLLLGGSR